ncbi:MAG TPA: hypothetical protein VGM76_18190, partial [Lacipirellulaceae bacterium]
ITFGGGPTPHDGSIVFVQEPGSGMPGLPNRPGHASFSTDGKFAATTFKPEDGLLPGKYRVNIECVNGVPGPDSPWDKISFVPADYQPPELVVTEGQPAIEMNYDVPAKKK